MTNTLGQGASVKAPPRPPSSGEPAAPPRRPRRLVGLGLALVVLAWGAATNWGPVSAAPLASSSFTVPTAYSVSYTFTAAGSSPMTERLWVRRPFESVDISYAGAEPTAAPSLITVSRLGVQVLKAANAQAALLHIPAGPAPQDVRADVALPAALHAHKLKVVGHGRVLGRACRVYRSAET